MPFCNKAFQVSVAYQGVKEGVFGQEAAAFLLHQGHAERSITLWVHSPSAGPNWESSFAGPNWQTLQIKNCRTMFKKALLQDLQNFSPHIFFTFLIWMAASKGFPFASSRLTLSPIFCSFSSFARHSSKGFPFAAPTSFLTAFSSLTILVTLRAASFFGRALPTSDRTSASATWPSLSFFLSGLSSSSFSSSLLSFKARGCLLPGACCYWARHLGGPCQPRSFPQLHPPATPLLSAPASVLLQPLHCSHLGSYAWPCPQSMSQTFSSWTATHVCQLGPFCRQCFLSSPCVK